MKQILISACLVGEKVRYDGKRVPVPPGPIVEWVRQGRLVPFCPEMAGGLDMPRPPAQIVGGDGYDAIKGRARVVTESGMDVTGPFFKGAQSALETALKYDIGIAVLKEKSPSCGVNRIYDGSFSNFLIPGVGVTTAMLQKRGIMVFSENELDQVVLNLQSVPYGGSPTGG